MESTLRGVVLPDQHPNGGEVRGGSGKHPEVPDKVHVLVLGVVGRAEVGLGTCPRVENCDSR